MLHHAFSTSSIASQAIVQHSLSSEFKAKHSEKQQTLSESNQSPTHADSLQQLTSLVSSSRRILCLTGAGLSTESHIPDYRSPGRTPYNPISHQQFTQSHKSRQRYWARSLIGFRRMREAKPNAGHFALAHGHTTNGGPVFKCITQNVEDLHEQAGMPPQDVLHLHGTIHEVRCLDCQRLTPRQEMQSELELMNPEYSRYVDQVLRETLATTSHLSGKNQQSNSSSKDSNHASSPVLSDDAVLADSIVAVAAQPPFTDLIGSEVSQSLPVTQRPDGDLELNNDHFYSMMQYPTCTSCSGTLIPNVVFFGANVPQAVHAQADAWLRESDALLVVGSSLTVYSAFRLFKAACARQKLESEALSELSLLQQQQQ